MLLCPSTWRRASLGPITCIYLKRLSTIVQCASWLIFSRNITRILTALSTDNYVICSETDCEIRSVETLALEHIVYWHGSRKFREIDLNRIALFGRSCSNHTLYTCIFIFMLFLSYKIFCWKNYACMKCIHNKSCLPRSLCFLFHISA